MKADNLEFFLAQSLSRLARQAIHLKLSITQLDTDTDIEPLERLDRYEALTARFARLQNLLVGSFRSIARLEFEDAAAERIPDLVLLMEKRQIVEDARHWRRMHDLSNAIAHDSWKDEQERDELFREALGYSRELLKIFDRLLAYVGRQRLT